MPDEMTSEWNTPPERDTATAMRRGFRGRCPNCGQGRLFKGYLKVRSPCEICGHENAIYPSDDFPAYATIFLAGHLLLVIFILTDRAYEPSVWLSVAIWVPATVIVCLVLLPFLKGAIIGLCWATNTVRRNEPV